MRTIGHITSAHDVGDKLRLRLQSDLGGYTTMAVHEVEIKATDTNKRAFYLGRKVEITVTPK